MTANDDMDGRLFRPTRQQFEELAFAVNNEMREYTFRYIASMSRELEANVGEHVGSGLYLGLGHESYLLTNEHVARKIKGRPLGHQLVDGGDVTRVTNPVQGALAPYDLAVTRIDHAAWAQTGNGRRALPANRIAEKHDPVEMEFLFLMGYSGERSHFSPGYETLITIGTPLLTQESKSPPQGLSQMFFALPYAPDLSKSRDPKSKGLPIPGGFSGAPVWDTNFRRCMVEGRSWTPEESRVTGILFGWVETTAHVLALRIDYVREFLLYALRNEAAYFHWVARGRPSNDALHDWLWAEAAFRSL